MIGQAGKRRGDCYVHVRFVTEGLAHATNTHERYDISFMFDTHDAHRLAASIDELANYAEHI
jgi:hypothetical protein